LALNVASALIRATERYPDRTALIFREKRWTYVEWNRRVNRLAHALSNFGLRPHDRVAIYLANSEESVTTYLATQKLGAVAVPINARLSAGEAEHIVQDSGSRILVYHESLRPQVEKMGDSCSGIHHHLSVEAGEADPLPGHHRFETVIDEEDQDEEPLYLNQPGNISSLIYTSGTTGLPKGVIHTHENEIAIAMNCVMEYSLTATDVALHIAPLYHVAGLQAFFLPHLFVGGTNVVLGRYDPAETLSTIERRKITSLFAVPTQITQMMYHPDFERYDTSSLKMITTGGASTAATTMEQVLDRLCPKLYNGYGMTEGSLTLILHPRNVLIKLGSCGKSTLITTARIIRYDGQTEMLPHETVERGEVGELIVQGPQVSPGYWNNPCASYERFKHGWLYTGDLFSQDEQGFFFFQGRIDDLIVSGGENIYPREVENVLLAYPGVRDAAVVGLPHPKWGHAVTGFVVREDGNLQKEEINRSLEASETLARFKRPKGIVFLDKLPRNATGKVLRRTLAKEHADFYLADTGTQQAEQD